MSAQYYYNLTGNKGATLFEALRERDFEKLVEGHRESLKEGAEIKGGNRDMFIDHLVKTLSLEDTYAAVGSIRAAHNIKTLDEVKDWLLANPLPTEFGDDEDTLIKEWASEQADMDAQDGVIWDHFDKGDDVETALNFGLITYPPTNESGAYVGGGPNTIPADIANKIHALCAEREKGEKDLEISKEITRLEREAVQNIIRVSGFYCNIHDGKAEYDIPVPKYKVLTCPSCGHPICPVCANCHSKDPETVADAKKYLASCDTVSGDAYCGSCGDYGEEFMLRFLKLVGCRIPKGYAKQKPRKAKFYMTAKVDALPDASRVLAEVSKKFAEGSTGYIKVSHPLGELWGIPDRYPEGWRVTIMYPEER